MDATRPADEAPVALLSVGAGPVEHRLSRLFFRRAVAHAVYCSFRDRGSKTFMTGLDVRNVAWSVRPDLVYSLPKPRPQTANTEQRVGIGVMAYYGWHADPGTGAATYEAYVAKICEVVCASFAAART